MGLGISELVLWAAAESADIPYTWSKVVSTFFVFVFNFIVKRRLLFSPAKN
jgi:putative flippase GtrA